MREGITRRKESVWQINKWEMAAGSASDFCLCCLFTLIKTTLHNWQNKAHRDEGYRVCVLTGILDLDGGIGLRVRFVNHLSADLLCQNLPRKTIDSRQLMSDNNSLNSASCTQGSV